MNCKVCGNEWHEPDSYCPGCGSPVLPQRHARKLWELLLAILVVIAAVWAVIRARE
jgi:uncharacterized OB-fold protein